jgi:hypothetical protein
MDEQNGLFIKIIYDRPLKEVKDQSKEGFDKLVEAIAILSHEDLIDPSHFADMPADWIFWQIIALNSFEHFCQHLSDVINLQGK